MSQTELRLEYRSDLARRGRLIMKPLAQVSFSITLILLIGLFPASALAPSIFWITAVAALFMSICSFFCIYPALLLADSTLFLSRDGISLPVVLGGSIRQRIDKEWTALRSIVIDASRDRAASPLLNLYFETGSPLTLNTANFTDNDLDNLLVALSVWGAQAEGVSDLQVLKEGMEHDSDGKPALSYTKLWTETLSRRFTATNFVPLEPGEFLQNRRLQVSRQVAFGGLAAIYEVLDNSGATMILKESVVPAEPGDINVSKARELFHRQASLLLKLNHPCIAKVLDHFVEQNRDYLLLELIPGTNLRQLIGERGPQDEHQCIDWAIQMAKILGYLHEQVPPIIHRDFTPDNLILRPDGQIVAIDFGASKEFLGGATGTMIGKQAYAPPEQIRGKPTPASDLYALGCSLYFLLTGKDPQALSTARPRDTVAGISPELDDFVAKCTQTDVTKRFQSAGEALAKLSIILTRGPQAGEPGNAL